MEAIFDRSTRGPGHGAGLGRPDRPRWSWTGRAGSAIPAYLREYARLESAVLIHGAITHIEFWDPEEWAVRGAPGDAELADPAVPIGPPP